MSAPIKGNDHIHADPEAFLASFKRAREQFGRIKGVVGIAHGLKETAGRFGEDSAIIVYVTKKIPEAEITPENRIPPTFEGYRTDVRVLLPTEEFGKTCDDKNAHDVITGGIQIKAIGSDPPPDPEGAGTLGCIVHKRGDTGDDNVYLLTCEHALLHPDLNTSNGDGVYQPSLPKTTPVVKQGTLLGKIESQYVHKCHVDAEGESVFDEPDAGPPNPHIAMIDSFFEEFYVDCGAVRIDLGSFCCGSACTRNDIKYETTIPYLNTRPHQLGIDAADVDRITDVRDLLKEDPTSLHGLRVFKNGRTTARTAGKITAAPAPGHNIILDHVTRFHYNVIEISQDDDAFISNLCSDTNSFSESGDSGAIIVDEQNRAVGLLYAGRRHPNEAGIKLSYACFIVPVLNTLGMCIPTTTGTSHGSSKATDGSGLAAYAGEPDHPQDDGTVLFSGQRIAATPARRTSPLATPASEEQRVRMQPLLDALLETERGSVLQDDFSQLSREIAYLVRRNRQVMVAWHRNRGPAFLACVLNHLKGEAETLPREIKGIDRAKLLKSMEKVLYAHGSNPLREAIERHRDLPMLLAEADTAIECIELLGRSEERVIT